MTLFGATPSVDGHAVASSVTAPQVVADRAVTRRETDVLEALVDRLTNAEIAARLFISERTVESHVSSLLRKFGARDRLQLGVLGKSVATARGPTGAAPLPPALRFHADPASYVGRSEECALLLDMWKRATAGNLLVGIVTGEAGIGKSRLVAEVASRVHADGARVMFGACFEDVLVPYAPLIQAIAAELGTATESEVRRRLRGAGELGRMVPELAERAPDAQVPIFDPASAQVELFAALLNYFCNVAEHGPVLLVVDDVHWASSITRQALRHLARFGGHAPALVLMTTRAVPPDLDDALAGFLAELSRLPTVDRVDLDGLPEPDVAVLMAELGIDANPSTVAEATGGNPLLVRAFAEQHGLRRGTSLEGLLAPRFALLSETAATVVDVGATLGSQFDTDLLTAAAGLPVADVLLALDEAVAAGLLIPTPGETGRVEFVHPLFRTVRYGAITMGRRLVLHSQVARALVPHADDEHLLPELARHACIAAPLGDVRAALEYAGRAALVAEAAFALEEAADFYRRALRCADLLDPPDPARRLRLAIRLGEVLQGAGSSDYREVLQGAAATARSLKDAQALAEVGWAIVKYGVPRDPGSPDQVLLAEITAETLDNLGPLDSAVRARTLAAASEDLCLTDPERAAAQVTEAVAIARRLGDPITLGHVLLSYRIAARTPGNTTARHPTSDEIIGIGRRTRQPVLEMLGLVSRAWSHREDGDLAAVQTAFEAGVAIRDESRLPPTYLVAVLLFRSARELMAGDLAAAEQIAEQTLELWTETFDPMNWYAPAMLLIRHSLGQLPEFIPLLEASGQQTGIGETYRAALAVAHVQAGTTDRAAVIVTELARDDLSHVPRNFTWLATLVALAEAAERLGDASTGRALLAQLASHSGSIADLPQTVVAPVDLALAQAAHAAGDHALAQSYAEKAVAASRQRGTPIFLARELLRVALARRSVRASADVRELVDEALAIAERTGARLISDEAAHYGLID